jgi:hypothetical protein
MFKRHWRFWTAVNPFRWISWAGFWAGYAAMWVALFVVGVVIIFLPVLAGVFVSDYVASWWLSLLAFAATAIVTAAFAFGVYNGTTGLCWEAPTRNGRMRGKTGMHDSGPPSQSVSVRRGARSTWGPSGMQSGILNASGRWIRLGSRCTDQRRQRANMTPTKPIGARRPVSSGT